MTAAAGVSSVAWIAAAGDVLQRISDTQEAAIAEASAWCADAIESSAVTSWMVALPWSLAAMSASAK